MLVVFPTPLTPHHQDHVGDRMFVAQISEVLRLAGVQVLHQRLL